MKVIINNNSTLIMTKYLSKSTRVVSGICMCFLLIALSSCDKEPAPSGPSDEDLARCAHIIDNGFLHQVCLNNPWPTELPPPTQEGLSTFGCWINDTLAFVANDPREPARKVAYCNHLVSTGGGGAIKAIKATYGEIDKRRFSINLRFT